MKEIQLTQGKVAIVDDADFEFLNSLNWYYSHGYAETNGKRTGKSREKSLRMQSLILFCPKGKVIDHINRNSLDNRRENLRVCTQAENLMNRRLHKNNTSGYKGVYFQKSKDMWQARIMKDRKVHFLGLFSDKKEAARAYNKAATELHGFFAVLNVV